jgi:hypothetical protein
MIINKEKNASYYTIRRLTALPEAIYIQALVDSYLYIDKGSDLEKYNDNKHIFLKLDASWIYQRYPNGIPEYIERLGYNYRDVLLSKRELVDYKLFGEYLILVLHLNPEFYPDVALFLEGKYSKFSDIAKKVILNGVPETKNGFRDSHWSIMNPTKVEKQKLEEYWECRLPDDFQVMSKPNLEEETLRITINCIIQ